MESNATTRPSDDGAFSVYLAFSGGGIRATLFHLGLLHHLKQCGYLAKVTHITSVSGGSITAGHLLQNWDRYAAGDESAFVNAAQDLIKGSAAFGIRQRIAYNFSRPSQRFHQLHSCYLKGLAGDRGEAELKTIVGTPEFHILGTDFASGKLVEFARDGIALLNTDEDGRLKVIRPAKKAKDAQFGLWRAVACSSAFPPMFPPHLITPAEYSSDSGLNIVVGDGGVYDNLGIDLIEYLSRQKNPDEKVLFVISDAGLPFTDSLAAPSTYRWALDRMTRASDIQFYRLADRDVREFSGQHANDDRRKIVTLRIGDIVNAKDDESVLDERVQRLVGNVRTDLDTFCPEEINAVVHHGWELARQSLPVKNMPELKDAKCLAWSPGGRIVTQTELEAKLKTSGRRRFYWRPLLSWSDVTIAVLIGTPIFSLLLYGLLQLIGWQVIDYTRYRKLIAIEQGQVGVLASWSYDLDKDEAVVTVQSAKKPQIVGKSYVIVVMKWPFDGNQETETKTVVSKLRKFPGVAATIVPDRISFERYAKSITFGDMVAFLLYVIPDKNILKIQHAIDIQEKQPLTITRIVNEFGGIKLGGGMDDATFDVNNGHIQSAIADLQRKREGQK
jgi:predicted acylesterase/phospholipase RssA